MAKLISVVGPSGIGKTVLVRALAEAGGFATAFEAHEERPFQALFKEDSRYGLANQIDYLLLRAEQERALRAATGIAMLDGGLDLDFHGFTRIFHSRGLLSDSEFDLCRRLYGTLRALLPPPELIVRLKADQKTVAGRLSGRQRINIASAKDFALFESCLDEWLSGLDPAHILEVDVTENDPDYRYLVPGLLKEIQVHFGKI